MIEFKLFKTLTKNGVEHKEEINLLKNFFENHNVKILSMYFEYIGDLVLMSNNDKDYILIHITDKWIEKYTRNYMDIVRDAFEYTTLTEDGDTSYRVLAVDDIIENVTKIDSDYKWHVGDWYQVDGKDTCLVKVIYDNNDNALLIITDIGNDEVIVDSYILKDRLSYFD